MDDLALELDIGSGDLFNATNVTSFADCAFNSSALGNGSLWDNDSLLCPSNDSIHYKDPSYYAIPYRIIGTIFQGFILMVGK